MSTKEGGLGRPFRHPIKWNEEEYYNEESLFKELDRVFDICHGCRRCFNLCEAFPILFDAVDEGETGELDGVDKKSFWKVIDNCYLCDMCFMTKCPYVPPHEWNLDFPALMLRAKAQKFKNGGANFRDKLISNTNLLGKMNSLPVISDLFNLQNKIGPIRAIMDSTLGISKDMLLPEFHSNTSRKRINKIDQSSVSPKSTDNIKGEVLLFTTCFGNYNNPQIAEDLVQILNHNNIKVNLMDKESCCGMPKLELGDIKSVEKAKNDNIDELIKYVDQGKDVIVPMPSCTFMMKELWPLLFPDDPKVQKLRENIYDPFEYLVLMNKDGILDTNFKEKLGKVLYHVPCHIRAQNMGMKTKELLSLIPDTEIEEVERCSGHDGTYAIKSEFHANAAKICKPVVNKVQKSECDYYSSDCPMAGNHIKNELKTDDDPVHPITLLKKAYGI